MTTESYISLEKDYRDNQLVSQVEYDDQTVRVKEYKDGRRIERSKIFEVARTDYETGQKTFTPPPDTKFIQGDKVEEKKPQPQFFIEPETRRVVSVKKDITEKEVKRLVEVGFVPRQAQKRDAPLTQSEKFYISKVEKQKEGEKEKTSLELAQDRIDALTKKIQEKGGLQDTKITLTRTGAVITPESAIVSVPFAEEKIEQQRKRESQIRQLGAGRLVETLEKQGKIVGVKGAVLTVLDPKTQEREFIAKTDFTKAIKAGDITLQTSPAFQALGKVPRGAIVDVAELEKIGSAKRRDALKIVEPITPTQEVLFGGGLVFVGDDDKPITGIEGAQTIVGEVQRIQREKVTPFVDVKFPRMREISMQIERDVARAQKNIQSRPPLERALINLGTVGLITERSIIEKFRTETIGTGITAASGLTLGFTGIAAQVPKAVSIGSLVLYGAFKTPAIITAQGLAGKTEVISGSVFDLVLFMGTARAGAAAKAALQPKRFEVLKAADTKIKYLEQKTVEAGTARRTVTATVKARTTKLVEKFKVKGYERTVKKLTEEEIGRLDIVKKGFSIRRVDGKLKLEQVIKGVRSPVKAIKVSPTRKIVLQDGRAVIKQYFKPTVRFKNVKPEVFKVEGKAIKAQEAQFQKLTGEETTVATGQIQDFKRTIDPRQFKITEAGKYAALEQKQVVSAKPPAPLRKLTQAIFSRRLDITEVYKTTDVFRPLSGKAAGLGRGATGFFEPKTLVASGKFPIISSELIPPPRVSIPPLAPITADRLEPPREEVVVVETPKIDVREDVSRKPFAFTRGDLLQETDQVPEPIVRIDQVKISDLAPVTGAKPVIGEGVEPITRQPVITIPDIERRPRLDTFGDQLTDTATDINLRATQEQVPVYDDIQLRIFGAKKDDQGYDAFVKRKKKKLGKGRYSSQGYEKINTRPLTKLGALVMMGEVLDRYTNRSGFIRKAAEGKKPDEYKDYKWQTLKNKFRQSKSRPNTYTELSKYAIDSYEEKQGIPFEAARIRKMVRGGF